MKNVTSVLFVSVFAGILASCAGPSANLPSTSYYDNKQIRQDHLKYEMNYQAKRDKRIQSIFYKIKTNTGEELCDRKLRPDLGIGFGRLRRPSKWFSTAAEKQEDEDIRELMPYASDDAIYVRYVIPGSAAEKAGIKGGDSIITIFGKAPALGSDGLKKFNEDLEDNLTNASLDLPVMIDVERGGQQMSFTVNPDRVCPYELGIDKNFHGINAYADGEKIFLSEEIIDYMPEDNDLAGILAHELAHNTMGHSSSMSINAAAGAAVGFMVDVLLDTKGAATVAGTSLGSQMYSKEFESEADYISVYYMARSGYDYKRVGAIHKKLAARDKASLYSDGVSHPQPQNRYAMLKETANEIDMKKSFKEELVPDFKEKNSHLLDKRD